MMMRDIDLLRPGQRLPVEDAAYLSHVVVAFNAMADRLEAERRKSAERALSIQEEERRRVARDLHDEIGQSLTALLLQLKRIAERSPQEICRELERAQEATRTTLEEVRGIVHRLRPGVLEDLGLKSALAEMASGFFKTTGIKVRRHIDPQVPRLSEQVELALYRICQESLTNVARHAHASCVELVLEPSNTGVRMRIADDGQGFDFSAIDDGGIRWMQERALLAGAQLELKVTRGRGVEVCVEAPATPEVARDAQPR
jgi:two-component system sensor histidine kinase UhpB